jgi:hypothetical protein
MLDKWEEFLEREKKITTKSKLIIIIIFDKCFYIQSIFNAA